MKIRITYTTQEARKVLFWLVGLESVLVIAYVVIHIVGSDMDWGPFRTLFDLDGEVSVPSWFSSVQLFLTGILLFVASQISQHRHHVSSSFLIAGSLIFIYLSADEGAAIHEKMSIVARNLEMNWMLFRGHHGAWITVYLILGIFITFFSFRYLRTMWRHFRHESLIVLCGFIVFTMGAVGFEIISYLFLRSESMTVFYRTEVACEEFLEMIGVSIILYAVLLVIASVSSVPSQAESSGEDEEATVDLQQ